MSTETKNGIQVSNDALQKHHLTVVRIEKLKKHAGGLQVAGVKDHAGLREVVRTRKFIKGLRLDVDEKRKDINAPLLQQMRDNNYAAKFIISQLKPSETYLRNIEKEIANEKQRIKLEKERLALERLQKRIEQLTAYECAYDLKEVKEATDAEFSLMLDKAKFAYESAQALKQQQAKQQADEIERLRVENEKLKSAIPQVVPETNVVVDGSVYNDIPAEPSPAANDISDEDKATDKKAVKDYATALQAVVLPSLKTQQAKAVFLNAHAKINEGINMLLKAVE